MARREEKDCSHPDKCSRQGCARIYCFLTVKSEHVSLRVKRGGLVPCITLTINTIESKDCDCTGGTMVASGKNPRYSHPRSCRLVIRHQEPTSLLWKRGLSWSMIYQIQGQLRDNLVRLNNAEKLIIATTGCTNLLRLIGITYEE